MGEQSNESAENNFSDGEKPEKKQTAEDFYRENSVFANGVGRDMNTLQLGVVHGDVMWGGSTRPCAIGSRITDSERSEARRQLVKPAEFETAASILREHRVVLLCGKNTGRSHIGLGLLAESEPVNITMLNSDRQLDTVEMTELEANSGYVWEADESRREPLVDRAYQNIVRVMHKLDSRLVIVFGNRDRVPIVAANRMVHLTVPPAAAVALEVIKYRCPDPDPVVSMFNEWLANVLSKGDPPAKAVRAAELAIRIAKGDIAPGDAVKELQEDARGAVRRWAQRKSVIDFSLAFTVAVLEHQPYDEVAAHAFDLDKRIRAADLPQGKALRPRPVFSRPKAELLQDNNADVRVRQHPEYHDLAEETVFFNRQDWANAVIHHVWTEYPSVHLIIQDWLCDKKMREKFIEPAGRVLCTIITEIPAHEPLRWVDDLASDRSEDRKLLAVSILVRLADERRMHQLAMQALRGWTTSDRVHPQWTAAIVYGSALGRRDLEDALENLRRIATSKYQTPLYGVLDALLMLLCVPECRVSVLSHLLRWTTLDGQPLGPRQVAYRMTLHLIGFSRVSEIDPAEFVARYPGQLQVLVLRTLHDGTAGPIAVQRLRQLALEAPASDRAAEDLIRIATLIEPDLRWWTRPKWLVPLIRRDQRTVWTISWIFHVAQRERRKRNRSAGSGRS